MKWSIIALFTLTVTLQAVGQTVSQRLRHFNLKKQIALEGYDPVSYFDAKPREGMETLAYSLGGVTYLFSSKSNLDRFKANPDKYEPAYGGWCAYAMGESGEKVKVDPQTYKLVNGQLMLFYNFWGNNTLEDWNDDEKELKRKADANWSKTIK